MKNIEQKIIKKNYELQNECVKSKLKSEKIYDKINVKIVKQ